MKKSGQIALMPFPFTNLERSKNRPVLLLRKLDNSHDDWLVCMISSQLSNAQVGIDWILSNEDEEFLYSGLKVASVFRLTRIAVLDGSLLIGSLGSITDDCLLNLRSRLGSWILKDPL